MQNAEDEARQLRRRFRLFAGLLLAFLLLLLAWTLTPLRETLNVADAVARLRQFGDTFGLAYGIAAFFLAGTLAVPLSFLTLVAILAYEPWAAYLCCLLGACLSAACSHQLGTWLGSGFVHRLAPASVQRVSQRLGQRGLLAVIVIRLLPVAPFALINMVIGASHIRLRHLLLGTLIGITPGIWIAILLIDRIGALLGT